MVFGWLFFFTWASCGFMGDKFSKDRLGNHGNISLYELDVEYRNRRRLGVQTSTLARKLLKINYITYM